MPKKSPQSIAERLALVTDINIKNALKNLYAAFGLEEKQLITDDEDKLFCQLQAENLVLWLQGTFDKHDDGTIDDKIKDRLNAMNNRVIDHYNGPATLVETADGKAVDEKAVPVKAREQLIQTKINLLAYACSNFKIVAIGPLLENIHQQVTLTVQAKHARSKAIISKTDMVNGEVLVIPPADTNLAIVVENYKAQVIMHYRSLLAAFEEKQKQYPDSKTIVTLLRAELLKLDPIGSATLQIPGAFFPPDKPPTAAAAASTGPANKYLAPPTATP